MAFAAPRERQQVRNSWRARLNAMADDRLTAIDSWLEERFADARVAAHDALPLVQQLDSQDGLQGNPETEALLLSEIGLMRKAFDYAAIRVFDGSGRLVAEKALRPIDPGCFEPVRETLESSTGRIEFHQHENGALALDVSQLILRPDGAVAGVVLLEMDPLTWLFPFLAFEPVPTETGEVLLVRQEDDQVRFLNPLRHSGAATAYRPLETERLAARSAVQGMVRFGEFVDYREVEILAATRGLSAAPWGLVVKVDVSEAFQGYRGYLWRSSLTGGVGMAALLAIAVAFRRQHAAELELALARQAAGLGQAIDHARDAILFIDRSGRIQDARGAVTELYGYSRQELQRLSASDLRASPDEENTELEPAWARGELRCDAIHRRKDGSTLHVEMSLQRVSVADRDEELLAIVRDVTTRRLAEERVRLLNRVLRTLSEVNQLVVREPDPEQLLRTACRIAVEQGGFPLAWVGRASEGPSGLRLVAAEGPARGIVEGCDDLSELPGVETALSSGRMATFDVEDDAARAWRTPFATHHLASGAAAPILAEGKLVGVFVLYVHRTEALDDELLPVVEEISANLSFALAAIEREKRRQEAEARLREGEARFRVALLHSPVFVFEQDRDLVYTWIHRPPPGLTKDELLGATDFEVIQKGAQTVVDLKRRVLATGEEQRQEVTLFYADAERTYDLTLEPNKDALGRTTGLLGTAVDISESKATEERLRKLNRAVEQSPASVLITDTEGRIEYVNPAFTRVTGYEKEEVLGRNPRILSSGETAPEVFADLWTTITGGEEWSGELLNRDKAGRLTVNDVRISPIREDKGTITHFVSIQQDITARKRAEEELEETQRQLLQAQKIEAVGRLAGGVAHDFNNLLSVITGYAEMLGRRGSLTAEDRRCLDLILKSSERAASLTRQLLAFSRLQVLQPRVLDLNEILSETESMLGRLLTEDIELDLRLEAALGSVLVDAAQIEQILLNLAVNARDAMPGGGTLTLETANADPDETFAQDHFPMEVGAYVRLTVSDTGEGMDDDTLARIFEPFFTTKEAGKGTGLGLSTVYGIVKQSEGFIWVDSKPGRGTTFDVYFPRVERPPEELRPEVAAKRPPSGGGETILVVEDQIALREMVREALQGLGYRVLTAADGLEALDEAERHSRPIDLLLTDVVMPKMNGIQLADQLKERHSDLRILFTSGYAAETTAERGLLEAEELLQKPFTIEALGERVRELLDRPAAPPTRRRRA